MSETINVARVKRGNEVFEVVIHPEQALEFRRNPAKDIREAVVYPKIFSDARKGMLASEQRTKAVFGTADSLEAAKQIIAKGEVNLTAEYKRKLQEQKQKQI